MMTFLLSAGAMIIVLLLIICIPLLTFRKKDTGAEELPQANIAIYRDQFRAGRRIGPRCYFSERI